MTVSWMVWTIVVSGCLAASALLAEAALRDRGWPTRWPWLVAIFASLAIPLHALFGRGSAVSVDTATAGEGWTLIDPAWLTEMGTAAATRVPGGEAWVADVVVVGWGVLALLALALLGGGLMTLQARASRWHRGQVAGEHVLLSRDFGPALIGVIHPEIVMPRWALRMPEEDQRLACLHESEHRRAHDTWLLLAAALAVAAMPWNAALWWQLRRLRAAVEVDCDARVLARGASRRAYGSLLLELGAARGRSPLPVLAFARSESLLERRLKMIVRNVGTRRPVRSVLAVVASGTLFVVACDAPAPTTVDEPAAAVFEAKEMPFGAVERPTGTISFRGQDSDLKARFEAGELRFFVDDEQVLELPEIDAEEIDRVEVRKDPDGEASAVYLYRVKEQPLVYLDGVRIEGDLDAIAPEDIDRVEVLKGGAATSLYGPEAAAGVIRIRTKKAAGEGTPR